MRPSIERPQFRGYRHAQQQGRPLGRFRARRRGPLGKFHLNVVEKELAPRKNERGLTSTGCQLLRKWLQIRTRATAYVSNIGASTKLR